jgi:hypothetical protein
MPQSTAGGESSDDKKMLFLPEQRSLFDAILKRKVRIFLSGKSMPCWFVLYSREFSD